MDAGDIHAEVSVGNAGKQDKSRHASPKITLKPVFLKGYFIKFRHKAWLLTFPLSLGNPNDPLHK